MLLDTLCCSEPLCFSAWKSGAGLVPNQYNTFATVQILETWLMDQHQTGLIIHFSCWPLLQAALIFAFSRFLQKRYTMALPPPPFMFKTPPLKSESSMLQIRKRHASNPKALCFKSESAMLQSASTSIFFHAHTYLNVLAQHELLQVCRKTGAALTWHAFIRNKALNRCDTRQEWRQYCQHCRQTDGEIWRQNGGNMAGSRAPLHSRSGYNPVSYWFPSPSSPVLDRRQLLGCQLGRAWRLLSLPERNRSVPNGEQLSRRLS